MEINWNLRRFFLYFFFDYEPVEIMQADCNHYFQPRNLILEFRLKEYNVKVIFQN